EEDGGAGEQGVILQLENHPERAVDQGEGGGDDQRTAAAAQDARAVAGDQKAGGQRGGEVGEIEGDDLGERQQREVEKHQGGTDQQVGQGVEAERGEHLEQKEGGEDERDEEQRVFGRALDRAVGVHGAHELDAEGRPAEGVGGGPADVGGPVATVFMGVIRHAPHGVEAVGADVAGGGQEGAAEAGGGPVGDEFHVGLAGEGNEVEPAAAVEDEVERERAGGDAGGERGQRGVQAGGQQRIARAGFEGDGHAVPVEGESGLRAAQIGEAEGDPGAVPEQIVGGEVERLQVGRIE